MMKEKRVEPNRNQLLYKTKRSPEKIKTLYFQINTWESTASNNKIHPSHKY